MGVVVRKYDILLHWYVCIALKRCLKARTIDSSIAQELVRKRLARCFLTGKSSLVVAFFISVFSRVLQCTVFYYIDQTA